MTDLDKELLRNDILDQHIMILSSISKIRASVHNTPIPVIHSVMKDFIKKTKIHLEFEDNFLYPIMLSSEDEETVLTTKSFLNELSPLVMFINSFMDEWGMNSKSVIESRFINDSTTLMDKLESRIAKEETYLFPLFFKTIN